VRLVTPNFSPLPLVAINRSLGAMGAPCAALAAHSTCLEPPRLRTRSFRCLQAAKKLPGYRVSCTLWWVFCVSGRKLVFSSAVIFRENSADKDQLQQIIATGKECVTTFSVKLFNCSWKT